MTALIACLLPQKAQHQELILKDWTTSCENSLFLNGATDAEGNQREVPFTVRFLRALRSGSSARSAKCMSFNSCNDVMNPTCSQQEKFEQQTGYYIMSL